MKTGRNDPCPCGSGKKYKKCCLAKDQAAAHAQSERLAGKGSYVSSGASETFGPANTMSLSRNIEPAPACKPSVAPEPPIDPEIAAANEFWKQFEAQDDEGKIILFLKTLEDKDLMNGEMAFSMLEQIHQQCRSREQWNRFGELVAALRERAPEAYKEEAKHFLSWMVSGRLAAGQVERLPDLTRELAGWAGDDLDAVAPIMDELAYHGRLDLLLEMARIAWPKVKASNNLMPWALPNFAQHGADYVIFDYLEHTADPCGADPVLLERLSFFIEQIRFEHMITYVNSIAGRTSKAWTPADFAIKPLTQRRKRWTDEEDEDEEESESPSSDPGTKNLYELTVEFLGFLHRVEGVAYTKGELARQHIFEYLVHRALGELEPEESMFDSSRRPARSKARPSKQGVAHPLCPDRRSLDRYFAGLKIFFTLMYPKIGATFELIPAWLRFLETKGLVDTSRRERTLQELGELHDQLLKIWEKQVEDPALVEAMSSWLAHTERERHQTRANFGQDS